MEYSNPASCVRHSPLDPGKRHAQPSQFQDFYIEPVSTVNDGSAFSQTGLFCGPDSEQIRTRWERLTSFWRIADIALAAADLADTAEIRCSAGQVSISERQGR